MNHAAKMQILEAFARLPTGMRCPPADSERLIKFEKVYGSIPEDYRWYLLDCGGGVVGSEWVDGIDELFLSHARFRKESGPPHGWTMRDVFMIGWDGAGNPYGIHQSSGKILVEDHNFPGIYEMARSFEALLTKGLLRVDPA